MADDTEPRALPEALNRVAELEAALRHADALVAVMSLSEMTLEPAETARRAIETVCRAADIDYAGLSIADGDEMRIWTVWSRSEVPPEYVAMAEAGLDKSRSVAWASIQANEPLFIEDYPVHPTAVPTFIDLGARSVAIVPVGRAGGEAGKAIIAVRFQTSRPWTPSNRALLTAAGRAVRVAIDRAERLRRFEEMALSDVLTGLGNRRCFDINLAAAVSAGRRHGYPVSVLCLDVDGLKAVNDARGHGAGDQLLVECARALEQAFRTEDRVYRVGGDELAVVLGHLPASEAPSVLARVAEAAARVREAGFPSSGISAGIATFPDDAATPGKLVARADERMYAAKKRRTQ